MNIHLMLMLLSLNNTVKHKDALDVLPAPQITCPLNLKEYSLGFKTWARKDVLSRQFNMAQESRRELLRSRI